MYIVLGLRWNILERYQGYVRDLATQTTTILVYGVLQVVMMQCHHE